MILTLARQRLFSVVSDPQNPGSSNLVGRHRFGGEQFLWTESALGESLLMVVTQKRLHHMPIGLEAVRPPVRPHISSQFLDVRGEPRQHGLERRGLFEVFVDETL